MQFNQTHGAAASARCSGLVPLLGACLIGVVGSSSSCHRSGTEVFQVASVRLTCWSIARGVQCRLLALSRDVRQAPRDVTDQGTWSVSGPAGVQIAHGVSESTVDGDVGIQVEYQGHAARQMVRLARGRPARLLVTLRGRAYVSGDVPRPLASVLIDVTGGTDAGKSATTDEDGDYEVRGLLPGTYRIRASKAGYLPRELPIEVGPGDSRLNVLMQTPALPAHAGVT